MTTELATIQTALYAPDANPARVYIASLDSARSRATMLGALSAIAAAYTGAEPPKGEDAQWAMIDTCQWGTLRFQHTAAIRTYLAENCGAPTANQRLSALRGTLRAAWRLGYMTADEYQMAVDLETVKAEIPDAAAGRALTMGEIMALVCSCADGTKRGGRDAAILAVAYSCGLRRAEIVNLDLSHYDNGTLTVTGKRNKTRTVPIGNGARTALEDWLSIRGADAGPLFWHVKKGDVPVNRRLTAQAIYKIMAERATSAGVKEFSPHDMRRTFAGDLLDAGADIVTVQKMMGHASVTTTGRYDRRGERAKQDAAKRLHFPYQGR